MSDPGGLAAAYAGLVDADRLGQLPAGAVVRVGTDVQEVAPVAAALRDHAERYLARVFTDHEVACSGWPEAPLETVAAALAGRYAAKEAVVKVLRATTGVPWREIEVRREDGGWTSLALSGSAAGLAESCRLARWALSFSHDGGMAVATVVALETGS